MVKKHYLETGWLWSILEVFWKFWKYATPCKLQLLNVKQYEIIGFTFFTFSISDDQVFWRYSESKTDQSYPTKWGNFDCTWSKFNSTWPIKVTPSVNKVNIILQIKINCYFFGVFFGTKNMWGNAWIKKAKYFYVNIFNISNFYRDFGVTLIAPMGWLWLIFLKLRKLLFFQN